MRIDAEIMSGLRKTLLEITGMGVKDHQSFDESTRIRIVNVFSMLAAAAVIPSVFRGWRLDPGLGIVSMVFFILFASVNLLNYRGWYRLARHLLFIGAFVSIFIQASVYGRQSGEQLIFIPLLLGAVLAFEFREKRSLFFIVALILFGMVLLERYNYSFLAVEISADPMLHLYRWNLSVTIFCSLVIAYMYFTLYGRQLKENQKMVRRAREVEQVATYFSTSFFGKNTEDEILWDVAKNCISRLGFVDCVIYILDEKQECLIQKAAFGPKNPGGFEIRQPLEIPLGIGIVGAVARSGKAEIVNDTSMDERYLADDSVRLSEIAVPLVFRGQVLGVIDSEHPLRNFFKPHHLRTLQTIAALCTNKIISARAEEAQRQAQIAAIEAERIKALDEVKSRFFTNISHELRTPLTLILGPLKDRLNQPGSEDDHREWLVMYHNAERLLRLINQLLDLSRLEAGQFKLQPASLDVFEFLQLTADAFAPLAEVKKICFERFFPDERTFLYCDSDVLEKVVGNLISNAFKYTQEGGDIVVQATYEEGTLRVIVSDTGQGIPEQEQRRIFERFYRASQASEYSPGSGIGLSLSHDLIKLHGGTLDVSSEPGEGSTFVIEIPMEEVKNPSDQEREKKRPRIGKVIPEPVSDAVNMANVPTEAEESIALIIDDDPGLRAYVGRHLADLFRILEADNGIEALAIAERDLPNIIICDVLMPGMDGLEFCRMVRKGEKTAHIPIILLTARADRESKIAGLQSGADDYLTKPFDSRELKLRVQNLLRQRERLASKYAGMIVLEPREMVIDSEDALFIKKAVQTVEEHLDDAEFSAESFSRFMNMSRMQLHRKLTALVDFSTIEFIHHIRLQRAAQLLSNGKHSISTIAYSVGFNNLSYFAKCFKDKFGASPSEYRQPKA